MVVTAIAGWGWKVMAAAAEAVVVEEVLCLRTSGNTRSGSGTHGGPRIEFESGMTLKEREEVEVVMVVAVAVVGAGVGVELQACLLNYETGGTNLDARPRQRHRPPACGRRREGR